MTVVIDEPVFYDCEASALGGLPIEIGWAFIDPLNNEIRSEGHLIRPPPNWDLKPVWDPDAEKLHRISIKQILTHGRPPLEIARRMNEGLADRKLYSDSPADDERWLRMMFEEARLTPAFSMEKLNAEALIAGQAKSLGWTSTQLEAATAEADVSVPKNHRAEVDARHLAVHWQKVQWANGKFSNSPPLMVHFGRIRSP